MRYSKNRGRDQRAERTDRTSAEAIGQEPKRLRLKAESREAGESRGPRRVDTREAHRRLNNCEAESVEDAQQW